jgi:hypothetical protein
MGPSDARTVNQYVDDEPQKSALATGLAPQKNGPLQWVTAARTGHGGRSPCCRQSSKTYGLPGWHGPLQACAATVSVASLARSHPREREQDRFVLHAYQPELSSWMLDCQDSGQAMTDSKRLPRR